MFESDPASPNWHYDVTVHPSYWPGSYWSDFRLDSGGNKPLANGAAIESIQINFVDYNGYTPNSEYLPTSAPNLQQYSEKSILIDGSSGGNWFTVMFEIDSVSTSAPDGGLTISPAKGVFVQTQAFDAALLLSEGATISNMQARVDGVPAPLSYPGTCQLAPPNSQNRPVIVCPNTASHLHGGTNSVRWRVELMDGTVIDKSIEWEVVP